MSTQRWVRLTALSVFLLWARIAYAELIDFEAPAVDSMPSGWSVAMTQRFPLAIRAAPSLRDGSLSVRFKALSGRVDQAAGLVWRYRDENNYYVVRANALEDNVVLYKVQNGTRVALAPVGRAGEYGQRHEVPAGEWHTLGVEFRGERFRVLFDGATLYEVEDATFAGAGLVGLWTKADSVTQFDDFEVSVLP